MCINPNQSQPLLHWMRVNKEYEEPKTVTQTMEALTIPKMSMAQAAVYSKVNAVEVIARFGALPVCLDQERQERTGTKHTRFVNLNILEGIGLESAHVNY